jgi:hypothetical protein
MSDGRRLALKDFFEVDGADISTFVRSIGFTSDDNQVDASGFNPAGKSTFLAGDRVQTVTIDVMIARGTNESFHVLYPLHRDKLTFPIVWRADSNSGASAANPELRGNAILPSFAAGANRGDLESVTLTFATADDDGFEFFET